MRALLIASLFVAVGCGETRLTSSSAPPTGVGPDAILLRVPRNGGTVRAYRAGRDSVLWSSRDRAPATRALLSFDEFLGLLVGRNEEGQAFTVDLRLGAIETLGPAAFAREVVAEGSSVFGVSPSGVVIRLNPVETWEWTPPGGADALVPNPDGSLVVIRTTGPRSRAIRLIPPETSPTDSALLPRVSSAVRTPAGDRVWIVTDSGLIALRSRDLSRALTVRLGEEVAGIESSPSGDRLFVATKAATLRVIDRFAERESPRIPLPAPALAMRMDPDGRYLLVRTGGTDSILVVSIGTSRVVSRLAGDWRDDLPVVTPDGRVLLARGRDVYHVDAETGRERLRYAGGGADIWLQVRWNGFRPRAAGLDQPVEFEEYASDSAAADSAVAAMMAARYGDVSGLARPPVLAPPARADVPVDTAPAREAWTVSFATLLSEERARDMATRIRVDGRVARVIAGNRDGIPIWRVVLGPYDTRDEAERAGMASRLPYWVFEGAP